ncbi:MAG TPA: ribokinase [Micromonosporaceae bacterium]|jgi:ribokinase
MSRVVVVGSANVDIITRVDHLPQPGQTLLGREAAFRPGGKGANQAVAASRLDADTTFYAAVGTDAFGRQLRDSLGAEGVHVEHLIDIDGEATGIAMIEVAADGENTIVVASGANFALDPSAVRDLGARLAPGDILVLQLEIPLATCLAAAIAARAAAARVVLNAAPMPTPGDPVLADLLRVTDVLIVNETEAAALVDRPAVVAPDAWTSIARHLCELGPAASVITLGARGAVAHDATGGWTQPAFRAEAIDTTGAGDAFCGSLAAALADGAALPLAVRRGCAAGALATARLGAQAALPTRVELDKLMGGER